MRINHEIKSKADTLTPISSVEKACLSIPRSPNEKSAAKLKIAIADLISKGKPGESFNCEISKDNLISALNDLANRGKEKKQDSSKPSYNGSPDVAITLAEPEKHTPIFNQLKNITKKQENKND